MREIFYTISGAPDAMKEAFGNVEWFVREGDNYMLAFSGTGGVSIPDMWQAAMSIPGSGNVKQLKSIDETTATCKGLTIRLHESAEAMEKYITECRDNYLASKGL